MEEVLSVSLTFFNQSLQSPISPYNSTRLGTSDSYFDPTSKSSEVCEYWFSILTQSESISRCRPFVTHGVRKGSGTSQNSGLEEMETLSIQPETQDVVEIMTEMKTSLGGTISEIKFLTFSAMSGCKKTSHKEAQQVELPWAIHAILSNCLEVSLSDLPLL